MFPISCLLLLPTRTLLEPQHLKVWAPLSEIPLAPGLHSVSTEAEVTRSTCRSLLSPSSHWWISWIQPLGQDRAVGISGRAWWLPSGRLLAWVLLEHNGAGCGVLLSFVQRGQWMVCKLFLCAMSFLVWDGSPVLPPATERKAEVKIGGESSFFLPRNRRKWEARRCAVWKGRNDSEHDC